MFEIIIHTIVRANSKTTVSQTINSNIAQSKPTLLRLEMRLYRLSHRLVTLSYSHRKHIRLSRRWVIHNRILAQLIDVCIEVFERSVFAFDEFGLNASKVSSIFSSDPAMMST